MEKTDVILIVAMLNNSASKSNSDNRDDANKSSYMVLILVCDFF